MSMPTFPEPPSYTICESLNLILTSIAMEELALSHILNAEGEKIQFVLGTLKNNLNNNASVEEILAINKSVKGILDLVMQNQILLKSKMEYTIDAIHECRCFNQHDRKAEPCKYYKTETCHCHEHNHELCSKDEMKQCCHCINQCNCNYFPNNCMKQNKCDNFNQKGK